MTAPSAEQIAAYGTALSLVGGFWWKVVHPRVVKPCFGFIERLNKSLDKVDVMSAALGPNGGKSLADLILHTNKLAILTDARVSAFGDQIERPLFEANDAGENVRINDCFERTFGYAPAEMLGKRWIRILHADDRPTYLSEWQYSVNDRRAFSRTCRYLTRAGLTVHVRVDAEPRIHEPSGEVIRWLGRVEVTQIETRPAS